MGITRAFFGKTAEGREAELFTLTNSQGVTATITNFGGIVVSLKVPDRNGDLEDVVLGYDELQPYLKKGPYFGAIIGRHANRIENAEFTINGVAYKVAKNEGENHLHGGPGGFDKVLWEAEIVQDGQEESLQLTYQSKDGEEGYPGNLDVQVTYTLTEENELKIEYLATSDQDTVVNLTNHSYFNLSGHDSGDILDHQLLIHGDQYTVADQYSIPTGKIKSVKGTPLDFTEFTLIGARISEDFDQLNYGGGYDHNWVLNREGKGLEKAAEVYDEKSGRVMEVFTTKPGIQFYSGNFLDGTEIGKGGVPYQKRSGLCLETQYFPNALKHKHFPSPILRKGEEYNHTTIYRFSIR